MIRPASRIAIAALLIAGTAQAQNTRGVRILPAEEPAPAPAPAPAPSATPTPRVTPAPAPRPAVTPAPVATPAPCIRAFPGDLTLEAGSGPRRKLRDLLARKPQRVVANVAPFDPAAVPPALAPWLSEVQASGGAVGSSEIRCTRGFGLFKALRALFGGRDPDQDYRAVDGYDATLWFDGTQKLVRQVEFSRRQP